MSFEKNNFKMVFLSALLVVLAFVLFVRVDYANGYEKIYESQKLIMSTACPYCESGEVSIIREHDFLSSTTSSCDYCNIAGTHKNRFYVVYKLYHCGNCGYKSEPDITGFHYVECTY